jgi:hypothetical protein
MIDPQEYRFLLSGISPKHANVEKPVCNWLEDNIWSDLCDLGGLQSFVALPTFFHHHITEWQTVFDTLGTALL